MHEHGNSRCTWDIRSNCSLRLPHRLAAHLGGAAQRADEVVDALPHFEAVQLHGGAADDLEDDVHSYPFCLVKSYFHIIL